MRVNKDSPYFCNRSNIIKTQTTLKILLSFIVPPILLVAVLTALSVLLTVIGIDQIDNFLVQTYIHFSAWLYGAGFVAIVLLPVFYFILWTRGEVNKRKVKYWLLSSALSTLISTIGIAVVYASSEILADIYVNPNGFRLILIGAVISAPIFSIMFYMKKMKIITMGKTNSPPVIGASATYREPTRRRWKRVSFSLSLVSVINSASLFTLQAWWMAAFSIFLGLILFNLSRQQPVRFLKKMALASMLTAMLAATPVTLNQLTGGIRHIGDQVLANGPESLNYATRFGLWWSAVWMSIGGVFYGAPYTVAEQVLMFWPGDEERLWNDDFPTKAKKVRDLVKSAKREFHGGQVTIKQDLLWKSYCEDNCDVGLALNGGDLTVNISQGGKKCMATARVSVSYNPQYRSSTILGYGRYRLRIDQAAYWSLQELGWLHPFILRYRWEC